MTKDRISEMVKLMRESSMSNEKHKSIPQETSEWITSFLEQVGCCRKEMQRMKDQIEALKKDHNQIQRASNESTRKELENSVEEKKAIITSAITAIRNNVKSIEDIFSHHNTSPALRRMRDVQINSLIKSLNEIVEDYYNCIVEHSEKCKRLLYDMICVADEDERDLEELIQKGKISFFTNNLLMDELEQKVNFRNAESRHAEILKVEQSILEIKNLTQDLSLIVAIQGERVDHLEEYVQKTTEKVNDAARIMKNASKIKNKTRMRKLIITLICISVMVLVVVIMSLV